MPQDIYNLRKLYHVSSKIKCIELTFNKISLSFDKSNNSEILSNFNSIYLILQLTLYSFLKLYMSCDLKMA